MTDIVDEAQEREEEIRDAALRRRRVTVYGPASPICKSCGDKIEKARRKAVPNTNRCTFCQEQAEKGRV
jgi:phage/conjugal plasmid C-4 type zinc finger TraR family protein